MQALGGTGALKVGADFLRRFAPGAQVWISDPSWENHRALFEGAGFTVNTYPYYDAATRGLDFAGMIARAGAASPQAPSSCCTRAATIRPASIRRRRSGRGSSRSCARADSLPFLDIAYQGFGDGIDADGAVVRAFAATPGPLLVASSFSKSFSIYGERVGALSVVAADKDEAARVLSQVKRDDPRQLLEPADARRADRRHGAVLAGASRAVGAELADDARPHQADARAAGRAAARAACPAPTSASSSRQRGMFSYSGLTKAQVHALRDEFSIYAIDTGRICVAALNCAQRRGTSRDARSRRSCRVDARRRCAILTAEQFRYNSRLSHAGIAQLVERNLAKVEVASSRLVSRSRFRKGEHAALSLFVCVGRRASRRPPLLAGWQSGHAAACKAVYAGSIPTPWPNSHFRKPALCGFFVALQCISARTLRRSITLEHLAK